ncbi:O-antigen ligase family protein [candidate division CSSED10-310 bacterium]|uniref:O-antigen ligase family protein n=1 Tax=candidate division CSSED10-310 bacterium TaxID=2855610 RepID=A0ABV6YVB6_UNCC1
MPGNGTKDTHMVLPVNQSSPTWSEGAVYLCIFAPALYFGGVRFEIIPCLQSILLIAYCSDRLRNRLPRPESSPRAFHFFLFLAILSLWLLLRSISLNYFFRSLTAFQTYITAVFLFIMVYNLPQSRRRRGRTLLIVFSGITLLALAHFLISFFQINPRSRGIHFLFHGFHYHGFIILVIGFGLTMQIMVRKFWLGLSLLVANAVQILSLLYYRKAGGILGFLVFLGAFVYFLRPQRQSSRQIQLLFITIFILINLLVIIGFESIITEMSTLSPEISSGKHNRWNVIYAGTLKMWRDNFFLGVGLGKFAYFFPRYRNPTMDGSPRYVHSEPLQLAVETGIIGLLLAFIMVYFYFRLCRHPGAGMDALKVFDRSGSKHELALFVGGRASIIGFLAISAIDFEFHIPANAFLFAYISAELLAAIGRNKSQDQSWSRFSFSFPKPVKSVTRLLIFLCVVMILCHNVLLCGAAYYKRKGLKEKIWHDEKAIKYLTRSSSLYPLDPELYFERGLIYQSWGKAWLSQAGLDFKRAIILAAQNGEYHYYSGRCFEKSGQMEAAIRSYSRALDIDPHNFRYLYRRGITFYVEGQCHKACLDFKEMVEIDQKMLPTVLNFFRKYHCDLLHLVPIIPNNATSRIIFASFLLDKIENAAADAVVEEILLSPDLSVEHLHELALLKQRAADFENAALIFERILSQDNFHPSRHATIVREYVTLLTRLKRREEAFRILTTVTDSFPHIPELWQLMASLYSEGESEKQIAVLNQGLFFNKDAASLYFEIAQVHIRQSSYVEAFRYLEMARLKDSGNLDYALHLATLYFARNMEHKSRLMCEEILEKNPLHGGAFNLLRRIYQKLNLLQADKELCEKMVKINPGHSAAQIGLNQREKKLKKK